MFIGGWIGKFEMSCPEFRSRADEPATNLPMSPLNRRSIRSMDADRRKILFRIGPLDLARSGGS